MPRNQITEPEEPSDELPNLSTQEEAFIAAILKGENNSTAYRMAYGAEGYSSDALYVRASRKAGEKKIQQHLRHLRSLGAAKTVLSLEARIEAETAFAQRAENAGNFGAAGAAHDRINKLAGLYVEQHRDVTELFDPARTLRELAAEGPEGEAIAAMLSKKHDIAIDLSKGETKH